MDLYMDITQIAPRATDDEPWSQIGADYGLSAEAMERAWSALVPPRDDFGWQDAADSTADDLDDDAEHDLEPTESMVVLASALECDDVVVPPEASCEPDDAPVWGVALYYPNPADEAGGRWELEVSGLTVEEAENWEGNAGAGDLPG